MNPILVEVRRNGMVESCHRGSAVVVDANRRVVFSIGDTERSIFPRSSLKFFQVLPLLQSGAADHFNLSEQEIALACASHNAEPMHIDCVTHWLARLGLSGDDLECGAAVPLHAATAQQLWAAQQPAQRVHNNCSGKHTGMLTLARYLDTATRGYSDYTHPAQQAWLRSLSELLDIDALSLPWERDGCGVPAICLPLLLLAAGFARFADLTQADPTTGRALTRVLDAVRRHPQMLAGSERCCTAVIRQSAGSVLVKTGAEGVYGGCVPHLRLGFALKIDDGAGRASEVALGALLQRIGALDASAQTGLQAYFRPAIKNTQGWVTGEIAPAGLWSEV